MSDTLVASLPPQFIVYSADKKPRSPHTGQVCDPHNPAVWVDYATAAASRLGVGVGFVLTATDPYVFIDIDHCLHDGKWSDTAVKICQAFAGAYIEVSRSGTGLHIICTGTLPAGHGTRNGQYGLECYSQARYVALTGYHAQGSPSFPAQAQLNWLISFPGWSSRPDTSCSTPSEWTASPAPEWNGTEDDGELIRRMLASRPSAASAMGNRATVQELWAADVDALSRCYPDARGYDASSADAALCSHLAFWTGKDCERMDRLFRLSGLVRDKWELRTDYRQSTILKSVAMCRNVYSQPQAPDGSLVGELTGTSALCTVSEQPAHFANCVYVEDLQRVWVPDGMMLKPDQFRVRYGRRQYIMDAQGNKTSDDAYKCFTQSQAIKFPIAHTSCFRPELPAGQILEEEGRLVVNTYRPITTKRIDGDPGKFTDLLGRLLPVDRDREILISYLASVLQNPGRKFQWWPVLQGTQGNGKSAIIRTMIHCVGNRYSHLPNINAMAKTGNQFNAWIQGKLFVGIEEIYCADRRDFLETFKETVTNDRITLEGKGVDQVTGDNRANGIMCTNHKDGVPVDADQRRYAILFTAQQSAEDKIRDGLTEEYFADLYDWLYGRGEYCRLGVNYGFSIINNWLRQYAIAAEFDPARLCQVAPRTSSTSEAIRLSLGIVEQEVIEAHESGLYGFCGDWISSTHLNRWLIANGLDKRMPRNKRRSMLRSLGYEPHAGLRDGKVNNSILDGGFTDWPILYCKRGSLSMQLHGSDIIYRYQEAQAKGLQSAASPLAVTV